MGVETLLNRDTSFLRSDVSESPHLASTQAVCLHTTFIMFTLKNQLVFNPLPTSDYPSRCFGNLYNVKYNHTLIKLCFVIVIHDDTQCSCQPRSAEEAGKMCLLRVYLH